MTRLSELRRLALFSATRALQTTALLNQVERDRDELARRLARVDDERRQKLLAELQETTVRLITVRARLQSVGEKLVYSGVVRSQLVRGAGGEPDIAVFRTDNGKAQEIPSDEQMSLFPGDVVEVSLRLHDPAGEPPQWTPKPLDLR